MLNQVIANAIYTNNAVFAQSGVPFLPIIGPADDGPLNTPTVITQPSQAKSVFAGGVLAEAAAQAIANKKLPVLAVRCASQQASGFSSVGRSVGHGTSTITVDGSSDTAKNCVVCVMIVMGYPVGVSGGVYAISLDGGTTYGENHDLGTATSITVDLGGSVGLVLDLGSGTLVTGEVITVTASYVSRGSFGTLNTTLYPGTGGTGSASLTASWYPDNDYEVIIRFVTGGTLGTAGIIYQYTVSNGGLGGDSSSDWSQIQALGTSLTITVPGTGTGKQADTYYSGAKVTLGTAAETIVAGAQLSFRCYAPATNAAGILAAINALFLNKQSWERVLIAQQFAESDAGLMASIDAIFASNYAYTVHGEKSWIAPFRIQKNSESSATYTAAGKTFSGTARVLEFGSITFGDCKYVSATTGFFHKRPVAIIAAFELASVTPNIDIARTDRPALPVVLSDNVGNPDCYDAANDNGTMDDYGFLTLVTQPEGVFVNNPRMFCPVGQNIPMTVHRDMLNLHTRYARDFFRKVIAVGLTADTSTGHIENGQANLLENQVNTIENDLLVKNGWLSGQKISISRTDDLTAQPVTLNTSGKLVTLIYPQVINYTDQIVGQL